MPIELKDFFSKIFTKAGLEIVAIISIIITLTTNNALPKDINEFDWIQWIIFLIIIIAAFKVICTMIMGIWEAIAMKKIEIKWKKENYNPFEPAVSTNSTMMQAAKSLAAEIKKGIDSKEEE